MSYPSHGCALFRRAGRRDRSPPKSKRTYKQLKVTRAPKAAPLAAATAASSAALQTAPQRDSRPALSASSIPVEDPTPVEAAPDAPAMEQTEEEVKEEVEEDVEAAAVAAYPAAVEPAWTKQMASAEDKVRAACAAVHANHSVRGGSRYC